MLSFKPLLYYVAVPLAAIGTAFVWNPPGECRDFIQQVNARIVPDQSHVMEKTPCGTIEYAVAGPKNGPVILAIHGSLGGFDAGLLSTTGFVKRGYRILAPSRMGYLRTPMPEDSVGASVSAQANSYACLLDGLGINKKVIVYGMSAGAPSALKFAHDFAHRTKALILESPGMTTILDPKTQKPYYTLPLMATLVGPWLFVPLEIWPWVVTKYFKRWVLGGLLATPVHLYDGASDTEQCLVDDVIAGIFPTGPRIAGMMADLAMMDEPVDYIDNFTTKSVQIPTTLTVGYKDDPLGTYNIAKSIAERIPGARFVGFEDGGHLGIGHHVDHVVEEVQALIQRKSSPRGDHNGVHNTI